MGYSFMTVCLLIVRRIVDQSHECCSIYYDYVRRQCSLVVMYINDIARRRLRL